MSGVLSIIFILDIVDIFCPTNLPTNLPTKTTITRYIIAIQITPIIMYFTIFSLELAFPIFLSSIIVFCSTVSLSLTNSSTLILNILLISTNLSISGVVCPSSHFDTVCLVTFNLYPSSSCDNPSFFLNSINFSLNFIFTSSYYFFSFTILLAKLLILFY